MHSRINVTVNETELIMVTWKILSNYRTHGLGFAVRVQQRFYRRALGLQAHVARRMALVQVRTALVQAINSGEFYHG